MPISTWRRLENRYSLSGDDSGDNGGVLPNTWTVCQRRVSRRSDGYDWCVCFFCHSAPATRTSFLKRAKPYKTIHAYLYVLELGVVKDEEDKKTKNINDKKNEYQYAYPDALRLEILDALDACSLKSTKVSATARIVTASEEPAMASAFASALRAGKVSGFGVDGKRTDHARARWLDIDALARHLLVDDEKYIHEDDDDDDDDDHLEIPIFVFDQRFDGEHKDSPLLFTNAKPVEIVRDAIFVTRSNPINEELIV